ncbi:MAG TPA: ABC transporter substrate-binding protein [Tepidisphaeraceae bacterium]|jgi:branched-chain amino acid transport system substrate-binding protein
MLRWLLAGCFIIASLFLLSCDTKQTSSNTGDILIGHVASLTGDTATFGVSANEGILLAMDEINAKGGILGGRKIKVLTEDDRSLGDEAKTAANKLITKDKVSAILGEIASSRSIAIAPVCEDARIPMLSPGSTNPKVTKGFNYVFRNCFIDPFQGTAMATYAMDPPPKGLGLKKFAILYPVNSDYGVGLKSFFEEAVQKRGGQIVATEAYQEKSDTDFHAQLTKLAAANPEAIFVSGYYTEAGLIAKQARNDVGLNVPLLGGDGWDSDQTVKIGGKAVDGCYFSNHYSPDEQRPEVQTFVSAYRAKYSGKTPDAMAILGYDAMRIMADAITRAGGTDPDKIRDAIASTKDFPGASGVTTIDKDHNAKKSVVILKITDGQFKYAGTVKPD